MLRTSKDAKIRLYDSAATPYYLEIDLDSADFSGPLGTPRPEEVLVLDRQTMDANAHYRPGADDKLMEPQELSFTIRLTDATQTTNILAWLAAMNDAGATQVNSHTLATTKGDTQRDGANANPAFVDTNKLCCNVEYKIERGGTDLVIKYFEVWFPIDEAKLSEGEDAISIAVSGKVFGTITRATSFTAGTDVEA